MIHLPSPSLLAHTDKGSLHTHQKTSENKKIINESHSPVKNERKITPSYSYANVSLIQTLKKAIQTKTDFSLFIS